MKDFIFVLKTIKEWCIFIAPYAAIAILPAIAASIWIMRSIIQEDKKRSKSAATDLDQHRYIA